MSAITLEETITRHGVEVHDYLDRESLVPIVSGLARQGDVIAVPAHVPPASTPVPAAGVPVVRGENGGNTHLLLGEGDVRFDGWAASAASLTLGVLTVAPGGTAFLAHPEHGYVGFGPGTYTFRRQREQADELRMVAD